MASLTRRWAPVTISRQSSGSIDSANAVDPTMSANKAVTRFRSPSILSRPARILSAIVEGAARRRASRFPLRGTWVVGAAPALWSNPQWRQKRDPAETACPQLGHARSNGWPQFSQNRASGALVKLQLGQFIG